MKTINTIIGSILLILGVVSVAASIIIAAGQCATNTFAAALLHVPTCDQTTASFFVLLVLGIIFMIVGAVVLLKGRERHVSAARMLAPEQVPSTTSAAPVIYCRQCGKQTSTSSLYCDRCGTVLRLSRAV